MTARRLSRVLTLTLPLGLVALIGTGCTEPLLDEGGIGVISAPGFEQGEVVYYENGLSTASNDDFCGDQVEGDGCVGAGARADACADTDVADVAVVAGEHFDVLCYATGDAVDVIDATSLDESLNLYGDRGDTLVVVDENASSPARGDLNLDLGANVAVFGAGPDRSIVRGHLNAHRGNVSLRNVTLEGDASFNSNDGRSSIAYCRILGNLNVHVEQFSAVGCRVFGDVSINRDGATLVGLGVGGHFNQHGDARCSGCYSFDDRNGDDRVEPEERTGSIECRDDGSDPTDPPEPTDPPGGGGDGPGSDQPPGFEEQDVVVYSNGDWVGVDDAFCPDEVDGDGCIGADDRAGVCDRTTVADVIDVDDARFDTLCYATGPGTDVIDATARTSSIDLHAPGFDTLIEVLDNADAPAMADLNLGIDANVAVLGLGPDRSVVDGNLNAHEGRVSLRGVRLLGDASFNQNNGRSSIAQCEVHGNLNVHVEDFSAVDCLVFGDVSVNRDGARLVDLGVGGHFNLHGDAECSGCFSFDDANVDGVVEEGEIGAAISCP